MDATTCPSCGRALSDHDRHVRFTLPDPVLALPEREHTAGTWMSHTNARDADMMQVPNVGAFVRALLPMHLTEGHQITYGVWLAIHPAQLPEVFDVWLKPEYVDLRLDGWLANAIKPWSLLAAPVRAVVREPGHTPYCHSSSDATLDAVLHEVWPHETVLPRATSLTSKAEECPVPDRRGAVRTRGIDERLPLLRRGVGVVYGRASPRRGLRQRAASVGVAAAGRWRRRPCSLPRDLPPALVGRTSSSPTPILVSSATMSAAGCRCAASYLGSADELTGWYTEMGSELGKRAG